MITQAIINKNLIIYNNNRIHTYNSIITDINRAKNYLRTKPIIKGCQISINVTDWTTFLVWFFACAELGLVVVTIDYDNLKTDQRLKIFGCVDLTITDQDDYTQCSSIPQLAVALKNDILIKSCSSGTTTKPSVTSYTHDFCYQLMNRNAKIYQLVDNDRCLHTKSLQHGSIMCVYLLPVISSCSTHYCATNKNWKEFTSNITRCLLYYDMLIDTTLPINNDLIMYSLSPIDDTLITTQTIYSIFGCIETSGPLFLPKLPMQNNCVGTTLDDFFKITVKDEILTVELPDNTVIATGDYFDKIDGCYYFKGRHSKKIRNLIVQLEKTGMKYQKEFDLIQDVVYNKIYLRVDKDIDISIDVDIKVIESREKFMYGIKFDADYFRNHCRGLL